MDNRASPGNLRRVVLSEPSMSTPLARAVRVHVCREGFTVFERVLRAPRRSPLRAGLVAAILVATALGVVGTKLVVPPLAEATFLYQTGIFIHDPRTPAACTFCETLVTGVDLVSWHVPDDFQRATLLSRGLFIVAFAAFLLLVFEVVRTRRPRHLRAGASDEIASDALPSTTLLAIEGGAIQLLRPDQLAGTLERGDLGNPYRANTASLVAAAEMTPRGPVLRLRAGDRVRARIADLWLDVDGLEHA